ncbi:hypothetical protein PUN28_002122 [Cardiocondyla obscurior]|uniref:Uncharacterized protein n=1 Tax=Cardiocondyla obscurior TaxID=286306 RepID=A0AAW2GSM4_9HYME
MCGAVRVTLIGPHRSSSGYTTGSESEAEVRRVLNGVLSLLRLRALVYGQRPGCSRHTVSRAGQARLSRRKSFHSYDPGRY